MNQGDEHTRNLLRGMKEKGDLASQLDADAARELLKTPPSATSLRAQARIQGAAAGHSSSSGGDPLTAAAESAEDIITIRKTKRSNSNTSGGGGRRRSNSNRTTGVVAGSPIDPSLETKEMVRQLEEDSDAFNTGLSDNTKLAKEQMQRSLLQLFEDTARDKLLDPTLMGRGGAGFNVSASRSGSASPTTVGGGFGNNSSILNPRSLASPLNGVMRPSRRPTDRGLDKRDTPSEVVLPDNVREQIGKDIMVVVDHELKRFGGVIMGDLGKIMDQVVGVRDRMCRIEEDLLQRDVEIKMQAEQLTTTGQLVTSLQTQVSDLTSHNHTKDSQMDLLRDQVSRRNLSLDETRTKFRKEVNRYKHRVYELETELEVIPGSSMAGVGRKGKRLSMADLATGEDGDNDQMSCATESAVKDVTEKHQEEMRKLKVEFAREKKKLVGNMNMRLSECDQEVLRLKKKLRESQNDE